MICVYERIKYLQHFKMAISFPNTLLVCLIAVAVFFNDARVTATQSGAICSPGAAPRDSILCVGKLRDRILVMTVPDSSAQQFVYDLPVSSLNTSARQLMISTDPPQTVEQKWPALAKYDGYIALVTQAKAIYNSFVVIDSVSEYVFLTTKGDQSGDGVVYDIRKANAFRGVHYTGDDDQVQISSSDLNKFYAIHKKQGALYILQYHFTGKTVVESVQSGKTALEPVCPQSQSSCTFRAMLLHNGSTISVSPDSSATASLNWDVMKGFVAEGNFYLFGSEYIYIFPESVYTSGAEAVFSQVRYADFVLCSGNVHDLVGASSGLSPGIIAAIVLLLLIIALCIILFCIRAMVGGAAKRKKRHNRKHSDAPKPSQTSRGQQTSQRGSVRSHGLKVGGKLEARKNGTHKAKAEPRASHSKGGASRRYTQRSLVTKVTNANPASSARQMTSAKQTRRSGLASRK